MSKHRSQASAEQKPGPARSIGGFRLGSERDDEVSLRFTAGRKRELSLGLPANPTGVNGPVHLKIVSLHDVKHSIAVPSID